nr:GGDEF domain-containing protein [Kordiimonas marina]
MRQLSWRDPLTGLYNRRYFRQRLDEQMATAVRESEPVSLVYFDIDHFKHINDAHGHAAGDAVLIGLSRHIGNILRHNEIFARVGGEEFVVMVAIGGLDQATQLAERIMKAVRTLKIAVDDDQPPVSVTLSLGVVEQRKGETLTAFLGRADAAMYAAKQAGRDRIVIDR